MLTARKVSFDLSGNIPKHWLNNDPVKSHFLNAFSVVLPEYERFFILTINRSRNLISNPKLKNDIQGFCAQEGSHSLEHKKYNQLLVRQGYTVIPKFERFLSRFLAFTAGGEHVTAFMGEDFLARPGMWSKNSDLNLDALWKWHAAEEVEHKAICFDVYQEISGKRWRRCLALFLISLPTLFAITALQFYFLGKDRLLLKSATWKNYARFMFGKGGYMRNLVKEYYRYIQKDFHPSA